MEIYHGFFTHLLLFLVLGVVNAQIKIPFDYLTALQSDQAQENGNGPYNYDNQGGDWSGLCSSGKRQSPIALTFAQSNFTTIPRIRFYHYDEPLRTPLVLTNNGHTANLVIPLTRSGKRPYINGGLLNADYEVQSLHFHWGSINSKGSEHAINNVRFDVEMHIVHKNKRYANVSEASLHEDGLAVLGIMLEGSPVAGRLQLGLNKIFNRLPRIIQYNSNSTINGYLTLKQILGKVISEKFFTYNGSLTTPDCAEAVSWIVFHDVVKVSERQIMKLWKLLDSRNRPLINNYRSIQDTNGRPMYYTKLL